mgnify:CR=1 FL=1
MVGMKSYYAILSGEHEGLALEELKAILDVESRSYRVTSVLEGLALFEADIEDPRVIVSRAAYVKEVGLLITVGSQSIEDEWFRELAYSLKGYVVRVEATRYKGYGLIPENELVKKLVEHGVKCSLKGELTLRLFSTEGVLVAGIKIYSREPGSFDDRTPSKRPAFKPGTLTPQISRLLVNLSRLRRGGVFLDPFCGVGGIAIEACLLGASTVICGDLDWSASTGALRNLEFYGCTSSLVTRANAKNLPLVDGFVDAIATDPPYGRLSSIKGFNYEELIQGFLEEARRVLRKGGYVVYAGPYERRPWILALNTGLEVIARYHMFVHGSLVREVVIARA